MSQDLALGPEEGIWSPKILTDKIQDIPTIAIHARRAHIHGSIKIEVLAVANDRALRIPTRGIRLDEIGQHFAGAGGRRADLKETAHW